MTLEDQNSTSQPSPEKGSAQKPAYEPGVITAWIRAHAPEFGLDANKLIKGQVISTIQGDDSNTFAGLASLLDLDMVDEFNEEANAGRDALADSLAWEASVPEMDEDLRKRLAQTGDLIRSSDWTNRQSFQDTTMVWRKEIFDWVNEQAEAHPEISEAATYFKNIWFAGTSFKEAYVQSRKSLYD